MLWKREEAESFEGKDVSEWTTADFFSLTLSNGIIELKIFAITLRMKKRGGQELLSDRRKSV